MKDIKKIEAELKRVENTIKRYEKQQNNRRNKEKVIKRQLMKQDAKKGVTRPNTEYIALAKERQFKRSHSHKLANLKKKGLTYEQAKASILKDLHKQKNEIKRARFKKEALINKIAKVKSPNALTPAEEKKVKQAVGRVKRLPDITRSHGRYNLNLSFKDLNYDSLNKNSVKELLAKGRTYNDAVAITHLNEKPRMQFGNKAPGLVHRKWKQGELYDLIKFGDKAQVENQKDFKAGKIPVLPKDDIGVGNEENLFNRLKAQGEGSKIYRPAKSSERQQYSSYALLTSLEKMLDVYFGDDILKTLILNKAASKGVGLRQHISAQGIVSNLDFTNLFGYALGDSLLDTDRVGDAVVNLARSLGIDVNAELEGISVGERAYMLGGLNAKDVELLRNAKLKYKGLLLDPSKKSYKVNKKDKRYEKLIEKYEKIKESRTI